MESTGIWVMYLVSVLFSVVMGTDKNVPISVVSGAYWQNIPKAVLYESSIPLLYKSTWPSVDTLQLPKDNTDSGFCESPSDVKCVLFKWIKYVDKVLGRRIKMMNSSLGDEADFGTQHSRGKRSLNFIGDFMGYCCGVATNKDLKPLFTNEHNLKIFELQLQEQLREAYAEIGDLTLNISDYSRQVEATLAQVINVGVNLTKVIDRLQEQEISKAQEGDKKIYGLLQMAAHSVTRQIQTQQLITRLEITSQCREKKIPTTLIHPRILVNDLVNLATRIRTDGYELVIPFEDVTSYFKLEIADCVIADDDILVTVKIPIRKLNSLWKLYEIIGTPFAWNNNTCVLQHEATYLAVNGDIMMPIKGNDLRNCQPYNNPLCFVPRYLSDVVSNSACVRRLFTGATIQELSLVCLFSCSPGKVPTVSRVNDETYVITHGAGSLQLKCRHHSNHTISMPHEGMPGALEVKVPCDCQLSLADQILVSVNYPCNTNVTSVLGLTHIIPAAWSKLKSLKVNSLQTHVSSSFDTFQECLDHNWPTNIPHLNVSFAGMPTAVRSAVLHTAADHVSYLSLSAVLHGIFMVLVMIIVVRNPYLLGIQLVRPVNAQSPTDVFTNKFIITLILTCSFVLLLYVTWRAIKGLLVRKKGNQNIAVVPRSPYDLPTDLVVARVDGRDLRISLEWSE